MKTYFKSHDNKQFWQYDHLQNLLLCILDDGCKQGIFQRCDLDAITVARQYKREEDNRVPYCNRIYATSSKAEFHQVYRKVFQEAMIAFDSIVISTQNK
jgi:hypothetical protein